MLSKTMILLGLFAQTQLTFFSDFIALFGIVQASLTLLSLIVIISLNYKTKEDSYIMIFASFSIAQANLALPSLITKIQGCFKLAYCPLYSKSFRSLLILK